MTHSKTQLKRRIPLYSLVLHEFFRFLQWKLEEIHFWLSWSRCTCSHSPFIMGRNQTNFWCNLSTSCWMQVWLWWRQRKNTFNLPKSHFPKFLWVKEEVYALSRYIHSLPTTQVLTFRVFSVPNIPNIQFLLIYFNSLGHWICSGPSPQGIIW